MDVNLDVSDIIDFNKEETEWTKFRLKYDQTTENCNSKPPFSLGDRQFRPKLTNKQDSCLLVIFHRRVLVPLSTQCLEYTCLCSFSSCVSVLGLMDAALGLDESFLPSVQYQR